MTCTQLRIATEPGAAGRANEDYAAASLPAVGNDGALVLLDGVTPPPGPPGTDGCRHGVPWFTGRLGSALLELASAQPALPLAGCLVPGHFPYGGRPSGVV